LLSVSCVCSLVFIPRALTWCVSATRRRSRVDALQAAEAALAEAAKFESRSETLAALVAEARPVCDQARAREAERVAAAAAEAAAAAAARAAEQAAVEAERKQMEAEMAALARRMQEMQQRLGSVRQPTLPPFAPDASPSASAPPDAPEETLCVVCADSLKDHIMIPCMHMCACRTCAQRLLQHEPARCPVCRGDIERTARVYS